MLEQPDVAYIHRERLFTDDKFRTLKIMLLMKERKYKKALDAISKLSGKVTLGNIISRIMLQINAG
jgi:hypothetical protein